MQNSPPMIFESPLADRGPLRAALTRLYRADENKVVGDLVEMASLDASARSRIHEKARALTEVLRTNRPKEGGIESFMSEYQLSTQEGVVLMCLAEALLRIPDRATADRISARRKFATATAAATVARRRATGTAAAAIGRHQCPECGVAANRADADSRGLAGTTCADRHADR